MEFILSDLEKGSSVHLVGIGGAGMSAIAIVLLQMGYHVEGSDLKESANVTRLRNLGAVVGIGHRAGNVGSAEVVVKSSAVPPDNPEIMEARRLGIPVIDRARMLAAIMATKKGIAVAGTHGKTTTSSLVTQMLLNCGADPSFLIGGELNEIGSNAHYGSGEYLVAEADESDGSLLFLHPMHVVLTNVEWDHPDYFESVEHTARIFREFLELLPPDGFAVVCGDDPHARVVGLDFKTAGGKAVFYGRGEENEYRFENPNTKSDGCGYTAFFNGSELGRVQTRIPGMHNIYNSIAVEAAIAGISKFQGVRRRFELVGTRDGVSVFDDYAHHPTEVKAVLDLASSVAPDRVVAVFQPHRYTRTGKMASDYGPSFLGADLVVVTDVYGAGEEPQPGVSGRLVAESISARYPEKQLHYVASRTELAAAVVPLLRDRDTVITMGAGDITNCAREILDMLAVGRS
jgi:UDP-N-acetylmuramate--alanine ligase